uniref:Uncharacterized protein n=1 Tax=viral metagenome TaxID=1070528 RepID=A0A6C0LAY2_9ZZZZ
MMEVAVYIVTIFLCIYVLFLLYCILYFIRTYRSLENEYNLI